MFDQAIERAKGLDDYFNKHETTQGPLHGLPISLKDQFHVKGVDTTMGYVGWIDTYEGEKDPSKVHKVGSQIVEELLSLGAVMYCKVSRLSVSLALGYDQTTHYITLDKSTSNSLGKYLARLDNFPLLLSSTW